MVSIPSIRRVDCGFGSTMSLLALGNCHGVTGAQHLPNQSSCLNQNLTRHFMFQHCQPMRNHDTEQLQEDIEI